MDMTSLGFLVFLALGLTLFYIMPVKYRWKWLIVLSFAFVFAASMFGLCFMMATSVIVYLSAKKIEKAKDGLRKNILLCAIILCLIILISLKYLSGLSVFTYNTLTIFGKEMALQNAIRKYLLPIGLSYYTLQVISYLLDVYWKRQAAENDYWKILLFTCYFPQLVQGPISKYSELAPELFKEHKLDWKNIKYGTQLMLWGFFKKMMIADRIGVYVNGIFHGDRTPFGLTVWAGLVFYGTQLYCDFSGGIDVVRGISECFGIGLKENFRQPFFSLSLGEFWNRWHISLGAWMKDYVFYPVSMAGWMRFLKKKITKVTSRKTATRIVIAISDIIVFGLVGVWHGLGTNYFAWGLYNGIILTISVLLTEKYTVWKKELHIDSKSKQWKIICFLRTLLIVTIGWIFDCTYTAGAAGNLFIHLFEFRKTNISLISMSKFDCIIILFSCIALLFVDLLHEKNMKIRHIIGNRNYWVQVAFWTIVVQMIACFGRIASAGGFMYANF